MPNFRITRGGEAFNPCIGMDEKQGKTAFDMYTGKQAAGGHRFVLEKNGVPIETRETGKRGAAVVPAKK